MASSNNQQPQNRGEEMLKPADKFLIVSLLSLALLMFLQQSPANQTANQVFVSVDGLIKYKLPRSSEPSSLIIQGVHGQLTLVADAQGFYVQNADCPDHDCERLGAINHYPQQIVCLPNKVVIFFPEPQESEIDAIIK